MTYHNLRGVYPGIDQASATGAVFDFSDQDNSPRKIRFRPDGLKMFMFGSQHYEIHQYSLARPFEVNSATYDDVSVAIDGPPGGFPTAFGFNTAMTKLFICDTFTDTINQFSLPNPGTLVGAADDSVSLDVGAVMGNTSFYGIALTAEDTKLLILLDSPESVIQFSLPNAGELAGATDDSLSLDIVGGDTAPADMAVADGETKLLILDNVDRSIHQYALPTPGTLEGASYDDLSLDTDEPGVIGMALDPDSKVLATVGITSRSVTEFHVAPYYRNPLTGDLNVRDKTPPSEAKERLVTYPLDPVPSPVYETEEIDVGQDGDVRIWGDIRAVLYASQTGNADASLSIDYRSSDGEYDGFQGWGVGQVTARYVKARVTQDTTNGAVILQRFSITVDAEDRTESAEGVTIAPGGTTINFAVPFFNVPNVQVTAEDASSPIAARFAVKSAVTGSGFTAHVFDASGNDVGGTVDWGARGV